MDIIGVFSVCIQLTVRSDILIIVLLILGNHIGQKDTSYRDFGYDFCRNRRYCVVLSTETFRTNVVGCRWNNYTKVKQGEKKII